MRTETNITDVIDAPMPRLDLLPIAYPSLITTHAPPWGMGCGAGHEPNNSSLTRGGRPGGVTTITATRVITLVATIPPLTLFSTCFFLEVLLSEGFFEKRHHRPIDHREMVEPRAVN